MGEYYVWNTEAEAQAALDFINESDWFPIVGRNAKTNVLQPNKQHTTCWADKVVERVDGKWCFSRITEKILNILNISAEERQQFLDGFAPVIEEYQDGWFPIVVEEIE